MANNKPLTSDEKLEIVEVLKRDNLSHRAVAKQFNRSQSTVSQIARDAGITPTHRRRRTPAAKDIGGSFGGRERIKLADSVLGVISQMIKGGGHNPRELKDITQALMLALEARRAEDPPRDRRGQERRDSVRGHTAGRPQDPPYPGTIDSQCCPTLYKKVHTRCSPHGDAPG